MDEKTIEEFKKESEKLYPNMTEERREQFIRSLFRLAYYAFDEFMKEIDEELRDKE